MLPNDDLVLGIDGGGSKTAAWIARCRADGETAVIGRGSAGGSNPQAVGLQPALENLSLAVEAARKEAGVSPGPLAAGVLGLAGSDRAEIRQPIVRWAEEHGVARRFRVDHDALPVLAAGSAEAWGVALIAGTGSFAFGQDRQGRTARAGGWGFLLGDEGSGYAIARAGLRAAFQAADGRGRATRLLDDLLLRLQCSQATDLVPAIYRFANDPGAVAALSPLVFAAAESGDEVAAWIIAVEGRELAAMVGAVATKLDFGAGPFPLAMAGGVLLGNRLLCETLQAGAAEHGLRVSPVVPVPHPVAGAVQLAARLRAESEGAVHAP
jgi:N-acetylglucosamine kinase-like BadF-type ATPase